MSCGQYEGVIRGSVSSQYHKLSFLTTFSLVGKYAGTVKTLTFPCTWFVKKEGFLNKYFDQNWWSYGRPSIHWPSKRFWKEFIGINSRSVSLDFCQFEL